MHLVKCLESEKMDQFPRSKQPASTNIRSFATIPVYCFCRMPETMDNMIECEICLQWLHSITGVLAYTVRRTQRPGTALNAEESQREENMSNFFYAYTYSCHVHLHAVHVYIYNVHPHAVSLLY